MQIEWRTRAIRDMRRLDTRDRERVIAKIEQYASDPAALANQVIILAGSRYWRLRVGNYRVIFNAESDGIMIVLRVRHRRAAYE